MLGHRKIDRRSFTGAPVPKITRLAKSVKSADAIEPSGVYRPKVIIDGHLTEE